MSLFERIKIRWYFFKSARLIKAKYVKAIKSINRIDQQIEEVQRLIELDKKIINFEEVLK